MRQKRTTILLSLLTAGMLVACGQNADSTEHSGQQTVLFEDIPEEYKATEAGASETATPQQENTATEIAATETPASATVDLKSKFGENCITEQTFEVELSEYPGKVYFVSYAPTPEKPEFSMEIVQNDQVLRTITPYVPEALADVPFTSLDAVSFYDVNYDSYTDIVTVVTHGDSTFAAIYYGFDAAQTEYGNYFVPQEWLSDHITDSLSTVTIKEIRNLLSNGKKNGSFTDYKEAYRTVCTLYKFQHDGNETYNLIYVDNDDTPELVAGVRGYYASLYTFHDGTVYLLMDDWGYGAMGNAGYEYAPRENNVRNYNTDHAGAIFNSTYMAIQQNTSNTYFLGPTAQITTFNFDDANKNRMLDEEEMDSVGEYAVHYLGDKEISSDEIPNFDAAHYEYIESVLSLEELKQQLQ